MNRVEIAKGVHLSEMKETKFLSNRISIQCVVPLKKESASVCALLSQIFSQGSESYPTFYDLTMKLYDMYGASFGSDIEKIGDKQIVSLYVQGVDDRFAMSDEKLLREMARLLLDVLLHPKLENGAFPPSVVEVEKKNLIELIESELNNKRRYALHRAKEIVCKDTDFALNKLGDKEDITAITSAQLLAGYRRLIEEAAVEIVVSGCGDLKSVQPVFEKAFRAIANRNSVTIEMGAFQVTRQKEIDITEPMDITQGKLVLLFARDGVYQAKESNVTRVANTIFGAAPFSKLFLNVREKKSLCYYCSSSVDRITGLLTVDSGIDLKDQKLVVKTIQEELEKMQQGEITDEELTQAKLLLTNAFTALKDRLSSMESIYLSNILMGKDTTIDRQIEEVNAVTKEEVARVFQGFQLQLNYLLAPRGGKNNDEEQ